MAQTIITILGIGSYRFESIVLNLRENIGRFTDGII